MIDQIARKPLPSVSRVCCVHMCICVGLMPVTAIAAACEAVELIKANKEKRVVIKSMCMMIAFNGMHSVTAEILLAASLAVLCG